MTSDLSGLIQRQEPPERSLGKGRQHRQRPRRLALPFIQWLHRLVPYCNMAIRMSRSKAITAIALAVALCASAFSLQLVKEPYIADHVPEDPDCDPGQWKIPYVLDTALAVLAAGSAYVYLARYGQFVSTVNRVGVLVLGGAATAAFLYSGVTGRARGRRCARELERWEEARRIGPEGYLRAQRDARERRRRQCEFQKKEIQAEKDVVRRTRLLNAWHAKCGSERPLR